MAIQVAHYSECGPVRKVNQDSYCIRVAQTSDGYYSQVVVCDGLGGLGDGEKASATLINAFGYWFDTRIEDLIRLGLPRNVISMEWNELVRDVHERMLRYSARTGSTMGTTLSVILLDPLGYCLMQVGDTRIYLYDGEAPLLLTKDQTLAMQEYEAGRLTKEQLRVDNSRNVLLQCIGAKTVSPVFQTGNTPRNGGVLLCSDGFYHTVETEEIGRVIQSDSRREIQTNLLRLINRARTLGETDNATAVVVHWKPEDYTGDNAPSDSLYETSGMDAEERTVGLYEPDSRSAQGLKLDRIVQVEYTSADLVIGGLADG